LRGSLEEAAASQKNTSFCLGKKKGVLNRPFFLKKGGAFSRGRFMGRETPPSQGSWGGFPRERERRAFFYSKEGSMYGRIVQRVGAPPLEKIEGIMGGASA